MEIVQRCFVLSIWRSGHNIMTSVIHDWNILLYQLSPDQSSKSCSFRSRGQLFQFVIHLSSLFLTSDHLAYPGAESRHFGVDAGWLLRPAGVTPGRDPVNHPTPSWTLADQRTSAVTTATVHTPLGLDAAGAEHAAGEGVVEMLLAVTTGQ